MPKCKRTSERQSGERFADFTTLKPGDMPWSNLLHRSEQVDWKVVQGKINDGNIVQFDDIDDGGAQTWIDAMFAKLGELNTRFLYVAEARQLFIMSPSLADSFRISDVQEAPTFATH